MTPSIITLTTDFGTASPYVAAMKGVIYSRCQQTRLVDLSHQIPAQDVIHAAYFVRDAVPWFPAGTIHVVIVDPGVGTDRLPLLVQWKRQSLFCPDNGLWTLLPEADDAVVHVLQFREYWNQPVSSTFHGRDIFAACAAALANGAKPAQLGPRVLEWNKLVFPEPRRESGAVTGEVVFIDGFGNLITNIPASMVIEGVKRIELGNVAIVTWSKTYGESSLGALLGLISSNGFVEIAEVHGNAARRISTQRGCPVKVWLQKMV